MARDAKNVATAVCCASCCAASGFCTSELAFNSSITPEKLNGICRMKLGDASVVLLCLA